MMPDLIMVGLVVVAFASATAYAQLCFRVLPLANDRDAGS
jgi:hypothetical protein